MSSFFTTADMLKTIFKWKKHLSIIVLTGIVVSVIFSSPYFIKPLYKSYLILYPANIIASGNETPLEQALQILQSGDIRDAVINRFNLMKHYEIDSAKVKYPYTRLYAKYEDNVTVQKTEFESINITVYDTDRILAAKIADALVELYNLKVRELQREKSMEQLKVTENEMGKKKFEMDSLETALKEIRVKYNIINFQKQSQVVTKEYYSALTKNNVVALKELKITLDNLKEKGGEVVANEEHLSRVRNTYNDLKIAYENTLKDVQKELTYCNVVSQSFPAEKKSYPIRWLIVSAVAVSTLFFSVLILHIITNFQSLKNGFLEKTD